MQKCGGCIETYKQEVKHMGFSTDYSEVNSFDLIPKGEYEVIIKKVEERTTQNGAEGINLSLVIRNDVDQKYQNRYIYHTLWKRKEPTEADMQVQGYSFRQIMQLAKAAVLPSGKNYESVTALCDDLVNRVIRITTDTETYQEKEREIVKYMNESRFPECRHEFKESVIITPETIAKRPDEQFARQPDIGDLNDFEEILSDGDVPF